MTPDQASRRVSTRQVDDGSARLETDGLGLRGSGTESGALGAKPAL